MKTIICGAGEVGYSIADKLSKEGFEVTVIDNLKESLKKIIDQIGIDSDISKNINQAIVNISRKAKNSIILITGSLYLAGEVLNLN